MESQYWQLGVITKVVEDELVVSLHFNNKSKFPIKMQYDGQVQFQQSYKKSVSCLYQEMQEPLVANFEVRGGWP